MSDNTDWWSKDDKPGLTKWVFQNMAMGATYAALLLFVIFLIYFMLRGISGLLPEDPFAALELTNQALTALV